MAASIALGNLERAAPPLIVYEVATEPARQGPDQPPVLLAGRDRGGLLTQDTALNLISVISRGQLSRSGSPAIPSPRLTYIVD